MRVVLQRVSSAAVRVDGDVVGAIGTGLCLLVGIAEEDSARDVDVAVTKISGLRVFSDSEGRMNLSVEDVGGQVLVVSQFTLYGDARRGRRPSFTGAANPEVAAPLIDLMIEKLRSRGLLVAAGEFGAHMELELVNVGPVTLVLEVSGGSVS